MARRGGYRKGAGRPPGSKEESRILQKHYRVSAVEWERIETAAEKIGVAPSRLAADAVVEVADKILKNGT